MLPKSAGPAAFAEMASLYPEVGEPLGEAGNRHISDTYAAVKRIIACGEHNFRLCLCAMNGRDDALLRAIEAVGGPTILASILGIRQPAISAWRRVPAERVIAVERATGGAVTRYELRPDLYPKE